MTTSIEPTTEQFGRLAEAAGGDSGAIVMLNLLRFNDRVDGGEATGEETYRRYGEAVAAPLSRAGGELIFMARCEQTVIGPVEEEWDMLLVVRYPSRQAFLTMIGDPEFASAHTLREAALGDSRLVCGRELANGDPERPPTDHS